ncbi:MAG: pilus assembly protein PilP [Desulfohalobiaceae bacterium]|nr:pilus assembly protein PilP [Desulfohalobiaceae bacterium]
MKGHFPPRTKSLHRLEKASSRPGCNRNSFFRLRGLTWLIPGLVLFSLLPGLSPAAQGPETDQEKPGWIQPPEFIYSPKGKPDPFHPAVQSQPDEDQENQRPQRQLSPLERIEPSRLELVGILSHGKSFAQSRALVELPNGKGYILTLGMAVGRHQGRVTAITADTVVIQETKTDIFGEKENKDTVLKLHKKPGQNNG